MREVPSKGAKVKVLPFTLTSEHTMSNKVGLFKRLVSEFL